MQTPSRPLVSILIPAYKPGFFAESLASGLNQSYENTEILIGDDSEKEIIGEIINSFASHRNFHKIRYFKNEKNTGGRENHIKLFELARGEFIKFLNDDDLLDVRCVESMVGYFERYGSKLTLVTSRRELIDAQGRKLPDTPVTESLAKWMNLPLLEGKYFHANGKDLGNTVLTNMVNMIGEPTTALFRKSDLAAEKPDIFSINNKPLISNIDVTMWLNLLSKGDAVYIESPLSAFRIHPEQDSQNTTILYHCYVHWYSMIEEAPKLGFLAEDAILEKAVIKIRANLLACMDQLKFTDEQKEQLTSMAAKLAIVRGSPKPEKSRSRRFW